MASIVHRFDPPDRFVAGTVGEPGDRTFFLQARRGERVVSVALEKEQVRILAARVGELLDRLILEEPSADVPGADEVVDRDDAPLDIPIVEEFWAGTITLSWDRLDQRVVIEVFEVTELPEAIETDEEHLLELAIDEPEPDEMMLVRLTPLQARGFVTRSQAVVDAGREQCQFCGGPIDPTGHLCPRANGYRRSG